MIFWINLYHRSKANDLQTTIVNYNYDRLTTDAVKNHF